MQFSGINILFRAKRLQQGRP